jgi:hypothetical protein
VPVGRAQLPQIAALCKDRTEVLLVLHVMGQANYRNFETQPGRADGWTGVEQVADIADALICSERMVNYALDSLVESGVLEQKAVKAAARAKLVTTEEAKAVKYFGVVLRAAVADWPRIVKEMREQAEQEPVEEQAEQEPVEDIRICEAPILIRPGKSEPIELSPAARAGLRRCLQILPECDGPSVSVDLVAVGDTLRFRVSELEAQQNQPRKYISSLETKEVKAEKKAKTMVATPGGRIVDVIQMRPWELDGKFTDFVEAYRGTGRSTLPEEWEAAWVKWGKLLPGERLAATHGVRQRVEYGYWDDPKYVPAPAKYLEKEWKREVKPRKKGGQSSVSDEELAQGIADYWKPKL